jgi:hypothetical protein
MVMPQLRRLAAAALMLGALLATATPASAQYFGKNKVQYKQLKFSVLKTAHFRIYFYPEEEAAARDVAGMAERWYSRLSQFFGQGLSSEQPLIIYASHPDFEQTNVVEGLIDEGTGGVTEGLRRRITLPLAVSREETDHVLGHEMVHAFQYDMLDPRVAGSLPLWFIEGMAEYLSLGSRSPQTAMWLRDAVIEEHFPKIQDLDNPKYFPYRFGHGLWAYLGGRFGDSIVLRLMDAVSDPAAGGGIDAIDAIEGITGVKRDQLSQDWREAVSSMYRVSAGTQVPPLSVAASFNKESGGRINIGPALSPDGKTIAFMSERGGLSLDLYLADAASGRIIRKLLSTATDPHFDSLQFLNSAGCFSPDGTRLALATVRKGHPSLAIIRVDNGSIEREYAQPSLGEIFQPTWSPDARAIAFSAQANGVTDLFVMSVADGSLRQLTDDAFADLHPAWSPDNSRIAFVTDRFSNGTAAARYELASIAPGGGQPARIETGIPGNAANPQWTDEGRTLLFISDQDGRPNVYAAAPGSPARQLTSVATGVSGFTPLTPALAAASRSGTMALTIFRDGGFDIHVVPTPAGVAPSAADRTAAGPRDSLLPPVSRTIGDVDRMLTPVPLPPQPAATVEKNSRKMSLVAAGNQVGVSAGRFGSYAGGGVMFYFSDDLNEHQLATSISINGGVKDIAGGAQFINRTHRWNWGVFAERDPYLTGTVAAEVSGDEYREETVRLRQTSTTAGAIVAYPFSRASRLEFNAALVHIGFDNERESRVFSLATGDLIGREVDDLGASPSIKLFTSSAALVRDTSVFGATGPLAGQRARLELGPVTGDLTFTNASIDLRQYAMPVRPVTLAARVLHLGRYGSGGEDGRLTPMFLGNPEFVRGYDINSFTAGDCTPNAASGCPEFDRLIGSRLLVFNGEVRAPLVGLFTGKLSYGYLPIDIFGFVDSGVAWTSAEGPSFSGGRREFVTSAGAGLRANIFGYAVVELNLARPLNRPGRGWMFVFNLRPGF